MDKTRQSAKLKKKGAYLPDQPEAEMTEAADNVVPLQEKRSVSIPKRTYSRPRWKHYIRYPALLGIVVVNFGILSPAVRIATSHTEVTPILLGRLGLIFLIMVVADLMFLPSIVLECDSVEVSDEELTIKNLVHQAKIRWSEVTKVTNPLFLKFAIVKTAKFFYLINKRDIQGFNELIQTIQMKAEQASK